MLTHIFEPIKINSLYLKNRLVAAPTVAGWSTEDGGVNELTIDMYRKRTLGGWGLVVAEASCVRMDGRIFAGQLCMYSDKFNSGLNKLAEVINENGAAASIQLFHGGRAAIPGLNRGFQSLAPSDTTPALNNNPPRGLTPDECDEIISDFVAAAVRAKKCGFDMVLVHGANGMLIQQFLSPYTNHRTDKYGDRKLFLVEIIRRIRSEVGTSFPIGVRISGDEYMGEKGYGIEDMKKMVPHFVEAGADLIDVSGGCRDATQHQTAPLYMPRSHLVHLAEEVKKVTSVPVVTAGRIMDPRQAEVILREGRADLVAFCRGMLADPDLPRKAMENRLDDIRQCIACDIGCINRLRTQKRVMCAVNFEVGRHRFEYEATPSREIKKVLVIGGGPAGLEAARVSALRGFKVVLCDKEKELGGAVLQASAIPRLFTRDLNNCVKYLKRQLFKAGIQVEKGVEADMDFIGEVSPDVIIVATGARFAWPEILGLKESSAAVLLDDFIKNDPPAGQKVAVIGGQHGCEIAVSLARRGKKVTIIEEAGELALTPYIVPTRRLLLLQYMSGEGVSVLTNSRVKAVTDGVLTVSNGNGQAGELSADCIIAAVKREPRDGLYDVLKNKNIPVYKIGDCVKPANIMNAIHSGSNIARLI